MNLYSNDPEIPIHMNSSDIDRGIYHITRIAAHLLLSAIRTVILNIPARQECPLL